MIIALQFLLSLSILVILHEFGHFLPAKLFKTRVEKFYLFFNPWFSLAKFKKGDTEYGIGWVPLGGYVKISGMIDESMDTEQMKQPAQPWEFRSKPAWQRLVIMIGGVVVNLLLGFAIYTGVLFTWGKTVLPLENVTYGVDCDPLMKSIGFEDGDKIVNLDGEVPASFELVNQQMLLSDVKEIEVIRQGLEKHIALPDDFGQMMVDSGAQRPFSPRYPTEVYALETGLPAELAGLQKGDRIVSVNDIEIPFYGDYLREMNALKGQTVTLGYLRNGELAYTKADVNENGQLGFQRSSPAEFFDYAEVKYSLAQSIPAGYSEAREKLLGYIVSMKFLFSKSGASQMGGFVSIAKIFPDEWNWRIFWINTAWLSLILAFMNILPIPALDGGHVMFLLFEIISGRPPSQKVMERAQIIGIILLLGLLLFANGNDVFKLLSK